MLQDVHKSCCDTPEMCHSRQHSHNIIIPDSNQLEILTTNVLLKYQSIPCAVYQHAM